MVSIEDAFDPQVYVAFRRLFGESWSDISEVPYWTFPVFLLCGPYLYLTKPDRPPHALKKVFAVVLFTIWLMFQPYSIGVVVLLYPIVIIGIISGGMVYPLRMVFDSTRLVGEVIAGRYGVLKHDGNSNEGMATGISMGLSED